MASETVRKNIHDSKSHTLKKFVTIDENGAISVKAKIDQPGVLLPPTVLTDYFLTVPGNSYQLER